MIDTEARLRRHLQAETAAVDSITEWADVERRLDRRRRQRRRRQAAGTVALVASMVTGALAIAADDPDGHNLRVVPPVTQATATPSVPSSTVPATTVATVSPQPLTGAPATVVVARPNGEVVLMRTTDGAVVRQLVPPDARTTEAGDPITYYRRVVSVEGETAFLQVSETSESSVSRVHIARGTTDTVAMGWAPAISPDGRLLMYARGGEQQGEGDSRIVVRELATGGEREWFITEPMSIVSTAVLTGCSWAPDSRRLACNWEWEGSVGVWMVDTAVTDGAPRRLDDNALPTYESIVWHPRAEALAVHAQFSPSYEEPYVARLVVVDARSGRIQRTLLDDNAHPLGYDSTGDHLLYLRHTDDNGPALYRLSHGRSYKIADNVVGADW